jgi:hypothetical protein
MKSTPRTSAGLCEALFQEFDKLRNGESNYQHAAAVAKIAVQIISTKRLEIEAAQFTKAGVAVSIFSSYCKRSSNWR